MHSTHTTFFGVRQFLAASHTLRRRLYMKKRGCMDVQLKRGLLEVAVLAAIPYGYQIPKYYALTEKGETRLQKFRVEWQEIERIGRYVRMETDHA